MKISLTAIIFFCCNYLFAQKTDAGLNPKIPFKKAIVIGGNYTYIFDSEDVNGINYNLRYREHTFAINLAFDFSKHIRAGVDYKKIYTKGEWSGKNDYYLLGAFAQYKFGFIKQKNFFFGEVGYYKGNYCTCGDISPYKKEGIHYYSLGGGYNLKLRNNLRLDLAFTSAQVLADASVQNPYNYTQYIIGLDYVLPFTAGKK